MIKTDDLKYGPPGKTAIHFCVDMQRMFAENTDWHVPWFAKVLPNILALTETHKDRTLFSRFIPAATPGQGMGMWRRYYERWASMTIGRLGPRMTEIVPELARFIPPAQVIDKYVYSPWTGTNLHHRLKSAGIDTLIISGGETDVCVLSTVLGAVDWGFRVILVTDALCSSTDATHDSMMNIYSNRFGEQVEIISTERLLESWQ